MFSDIWKKSELPKEEGLTPSQNIAYSISKCRSKVSNDSNKNINNIYIT